jgi:hypothetical protein
MKIAKEDAARDTRTRVHQTLDKARQVIKDSEEILANMPYLTLWAPPRGSSALLL